MIRQASRVVEGTGMMRKRATSLRLGDAVLRDACD
jgi:hypothetical protein